MACCCMCARRLPIQKLEFSTRPAKILPHSLPRSGGIDITLKIRSSRNSLGTAAVEDYQIEVMAAKSNRRKRIKVIDGSTIPIKPLGSQSHLQSKEPTQEEIELAEAVFGFVPESKGKQKEKNDQINTLLVDDKVETNGLADLEDHQLFAFDESGTQAQVKNLIDSSKLLPDPSTLEKNTEKLLGCQSKRQSVWFDHSADQVSVSLTHGPNRRKKLKTLDDLKADNHNELIISGKEYEDRLRTQFQKMHPTPTWLEKCRQSKRKAGDVQASDEDNDESEFDLHQILRSTGNLNKKSFNQDRGSLPKGELDVARLRDANQAEPESNKFPISCLQFHPHSSILLTASSQSKRLSFFKIDGTHNPALHFVHTPDLPIQTAEFCPASSTNVSSSVVMAGHRPYFYAFDMQSCQCIKSPHGLFNKSLSSQSSKGTSLSHFKFSPQGNLIAFVGLNGLIQLVDWSNNISSSQLVGSLKSNTPVKSLAWNRNGTELLTVGNNAEVSVWDLRMRRTIASWFDDGGFGPTLITTSDQDSFQSSNAFTAIGSQTGIVNLYSGLFTESKGQFQVPRTPFKTIENITTSVSSLKFNPDAQILAIASEKKKDSLKLVHVTSGTVFSNWPTSGTPLGHVTDLSFNYNSSMLAIANNRGRVLLYSLGWWQKRNKSI
ncbi:hypothetical protein O181_048345 [Austropuccinia psidii MF-1]|uniref:Anaphase-promoting complex subunit 4 WD40 domain-containing protein n=1 Tax=Austropuccinia psidii MF-1 TaxID=1389203 RepID=A0A9Q3HP48_9BASI|nr:hypothetical protein [Austropuccinia psidii MF-1]